MQNKVLLILIFNYSLQAKPEGNFIYIQNIKQIPQKLISTQKGIKYADN
ncbi:hypothetical protein EMIT036CA2_30556 [Chryseobacterium sp. IT-36CA2]